MVLLEICCNSIQSARNAQEGGADRIELCQNLEHGGITPSSRLILQTKSLLHIPVFVLIRPRPGDFVYTEDEIMIMEHDIKLCKEYGVEGVVLGVLTAAGGVDVEKTTRLVKVAEGMEVTFHRAFDEVRDRWMGVEDVLKTGCSRLLTSGGGEACIDPGALSELRHLLMKTVGLIGCPIIVPAGGLNVENVRCFIQQMPCTEIHASCKKALPPSGGRLFGAGAFETDVQSVRNMAELLKSL